MSILQPTITLLLFRYVLLFLASSALVPVATMPGWLQPFARDQPASVTIDAIRALFEGGPVYHNMWQAIAWCAGIFLACLITSLSLWSAGATSTTH